jgi:hypothetical protein
MLLLLLLLLLLLSLLLLLFIIKVACLNRVLVGWLVCCAGGKVHQEAACAYTQSWSDLAAGWR